MVDDHVHRVRVRELIRHSDDGSEPVGVVVGQRTRAVHPGQGFVDARAVDIQLRVAEAIATRAMQLAKEPALAFHVGMQMRLSSHGYLGFAAMTANTAREALDLAVRFAGTRTSAIGLALYVEGDTASSIVGPRAVMA